MMRGFLRQSDRHCNTTKQVLFKYALIVALAIVAPLSEATSPCRADGGCIDKASAGLIGSIGVLEQACAETDPGRAQQYHAKAIEQLASEDADFLRRLRASPIYAEVRTQIRPEVKQEDRKQQQALCEKFFFGPEGPGPAKTASA